MSPCLRAPLRASWRVRSSSSMRCACGGGATDREGAAVCATAAASGFEGSRLTAGDLNAGGGPTGIPGGAGTPPDEAAPEAPDVSLEGVVAEGVGAGLPPAAGGGGVAPPAAVLPRRALRSIFGFFSSAIEPPGEDTSGCRTISMVGVNTPRRRVVLQKARVTILFSVNLRKIAKTAEAKQPRVVGLEGRNASHIHAAPSVSSAKDPDAAKYFESFEPNHAPRFVFVLPET